MVLSEHLKRHGHLVNRIYVSKSLFDISFLKKRFRFFLKNKYPFCIRFIDCMNYIIWRSSAWFMRNNAFTYFKRLGFETKFVRNINDPAFLDELSQLDSELFLFALFDQIAQSPFLNLPKKGTYNLHLGKLPEYRGGLSAFWVLRYGDPTAGVTLHEAVPKLDAGQIVAEKRFPVETNSMRQLMNETVKHAAGVVADGMDKIIKNEVIPIATDGRPEAYIYIPTQEDFREFYRRKNRLI